ncbi:hypothetical protein G6K64_004720, partial [Salmonella enterica subsp. enterica serovar Rubislaw]|nr:hypothetical protein [Salmonella enterica subsp. enterica serovar Rubislaw]
ADTGADFTGLTGQDIADLANLGLDYTVKDEYAGVEMPDLQLPTVRMVYYGELRYHKGYTSLQATEDVFHISESARWCGSHGRNIEYLEPNYPPVSSVTSGTLSGGNTESDGIVHSYFIGPIQHAYKSGGDTNPEVFVAGYVAANRLAREAQNLGQTNEVLGALIPPQLVFLNGSRSAAVGYDIRDAGAIDQGSTWRHIGT